MNGDTLLKPRGGTRGMLNKIIGKGPFLPMEEPCKLSAKGLPLL
jgi:hypothetical protein